MICITGDLHGDLSRLGHKNIKKLKKGDSLIICGDFGCIWDGSSKENATLKALGKKKFNVLFVDGCHENFDLLESYPIEEWNGGKTRVISGNLRQLMRGELFDIDGKKIFAFGGGQSEDKDIKKEQNNWWENETPTEEEIENAIEIKSVYDLVIEVGTHPVSNLRTAEAVKVVENSQRDINIAFMNELAMVFDRMDIDTNEVVDGMNTKWNALGFRPGLVGGHCIGKAIKLTFGRNRRYL